MSRKLPLWAFLLCGIVTSHIVTNQAVASSPTDGNTAIAKTSEVAMWPQQTAQIQLTRDIVSIMQEQHFRSLALDDALSTALLDNYLEMLDPNRQIFLASDIAEFNRFRHSLDEELTSGQLVSARAVFQRYYERYSARLALVLQNMGQFVTEDALAGSDVIEVDRKDSPWPATMADADILWRKNMINAALSLRLAEKQGEDIASTLARRYQAQLDRLNKQTPMDNFELFMNAYTELYDPHTNYMSPKTAENFDISMALSLEGIGAVLERDDEHTKITRLVPAGPADKQGELKPGDRIIAVAQGQHSESWQDVIGWRLDEVVDLIRGKADTWVRLQVRRGEDTIKNIAIRREKVKLEDQAASNKIIDFKEIPNKPMRIGVITVPNFYLDFEALRRRDPDTRSTTRDVIRLLEELETENVDGIIVDLRDNGGGSLREATQLTDLFIDQGPVVQILSADNQVDRRNRAVEKGAYGGPLLVLVNHLSASASEIFAGAIQDYQRGLVVGEQTFGKGTVQTLIPLYQGKLKITEAKFYRVSGDSTQHRGVVPDILYPALLPYDQVGESALEHALPWDRIQSAPHGKYRDMTTMVPLLRQQHENRMATDINYSFLLQQKQWMEDLRARKNLPLNLSERKLLKINEEKKVLEMNNALRKARNLPPLNTMDDLEEDQRKKRDEKNPTDDFLLMESARILRDYILMNDSGGDVAKASSAHLLH